MDLRKGIIAVLLAVGCAIAVYNAPHAAVPSPKVVPTASASTRPAPSHVGDISKYPAMNLTPGVADPRVNQLNIHQTICVPGYTATVRNVTDAEKQEVFQRYGLDWSTHADYEVDHFIPLEIGGANDLSNLWPESYEPAPGAHEKDRLENYLHSQVCSSTETLADAQHAITSDWLKVYQQAGLK